MANQINQPTTGLGLR